MTPLKAAVIKGLLEPISEENVTIVNANLVAEHRGLRISERKGAYEGIYANLVQVRAATSGGADDGGGHDGPRRAAHRPDQRVLGRCVPREPAICSSARTWTGRA